MQAIADQGAGESTVSASHINAHTVNISSNSNSPGAAAPTTCASSRDVQTAEAMAPPADEAGQMPTITQQLTVHGNHLQRHYADSELPTPHRHEVLFLNLELESTLDPRHRGLRLW